MPFDLLADDGNTGGVNGIHDMGGMHGFGPIEPRQHEETFHADWEKRVPGLVTGATRSGGMNIDSFRHGIERMPPAEYLSASYYERHLFTAELNLVEKGVLTPQEIEARIELLRRDPLAAPRREDRQDAEHVLRARLTSEPPPSADASRARYQPGDPVVTRTVHPHGHTRLPRYARDKRGVIERFHGIDTLPDANAHGRGPAAEPLYSVRFAASELWGESAEGPGSVYIDLWESYLEPLEEPSA
jgi:nitrile hydratase subunit beta